MQMITVKAAGKLFWASYLPRASTVAWPPLKHCTWQMVEYLFIQEWLLQGSIMATPKFCWSQILSLHKRQTVRLTQKPKSMNKTSTSVGINWFFLTLILSGSLKEQEKHKSQFLSDFLSVLLTLILKRMSVLMQKPHCLVQSSSTTFLKSGKTCLNFHLF